MLVDAGDAHKIQTALCISSSSRSVALSAKSLKVKGDVGSKATFSFGYQLFFYSKFELIKFYH